MRALSITCFLNNQKKGAAEGSTKEESVSLWVEADHGAVHFGLRLDSYFLVVSLHVFSPQLSANDFHVLKADAPCVSTRNPHNMLLHLRVYPLFSVRTRLCSLSAWSML